ncbi:MAG: RadC family protein [Porticoccaceae bacterium]
MAITQWPEKERPREKLIHRGASALSDAELLAIFLRNGLPGITAIDLARNLLKEFGGLGALLGADRKTFCSAKGVGTAKFVQLKASLELTRRYLQEQLEEQPVFTSPEMVADYLSVQMRDYRREVFAVLLLDSKHQLLDNYELFQGTLDAASVHPREVVARALRMSAAAVIVAHNHPSGNAEPSQADIAITRRLKEALDLVDIRLLDHFVIGRGQVVSLAQRGKL